MALSGAARRRKGHDFERLMARALRALWPGATRGYQRETSQDKRPDVDNTPFWIECKRGKRTNIMAALRQAEKDLAASFDAARHMKFPYRAGAAICKNDRDEATITMRLADFIQYVEDQRDDYGRNPYC